MTYTALIYLCALAMFAGGIALWCLLALIVGAFFAMSDDDRLPEMDSVTDGPPDGVTLICCKCKIIIRTDYPGAPLSHGYCTACAAPILQSIKTGEFLTN
jgi:hypothetical protein